MKIILLFLFCISLDVLALDEFSVEETFAPQEPLPATIISDFNTDIELRKSKDDQEDRCAGKNVSDELEATKIELGSSIQGILIKPKSMCFCGAYCCPMWIYQLNNKSAKRIWSTQCISGINILDKNTHGYRQIKGSSGTAGHSYEAIWAWGGTKYKIIKEKSTTAGEEE